jgi:hypothetical protein
LLEGELRPHLLRFLVTKKLEGRFDPPFPKDEGQPTGRTIIFEFYVDRARIEGLRPPELATYDDGRGKRLISGLIDAIDEFYNSARGPKDKGPILIGIPSGRGKAYEPFFSRPGADAPPPVSSRVTPPLGLETHGGVPTNDEIVGRWQYVVYSPDDNLSHCGECQFRQVRGSLVISGDRRFRLADAASKTVVRVRSHWESDWCEICNDGKMRFVYHIDIQQTTVKGFCQVDLGAPELVGTYHLLPPFDVDVTNAKNGTIIFDRIGPEKQVTLPPGYALREPAA